MIHRDWRVECRGTLRLLYRKNEEGSWTYKLHRMVLSAGVAVDVEPLGGGVRGTRDEALDALHEMAAPYDAIETVSQPITDPAWPAGHNPADVD